MAAVEVDKRLKSTSGSLELRVAPGDLGKRVYFEIDGRAVWLTRRNALHVIQVINRILNTHDVKN